MRRLTLLATLALLSADAGQGVESAPPRVVAVELRCDALLGDPAQLRSALAVVEGQPLDSAAVEASLRALDATGLAAGAEAWTRDTPEGVVVVFVVRAATQVDEVKVEGKATLPVTRLLAELPQKAGEALVEDRVLRGLYRIEELYRSSGYFRSSVRLAVTTDPPRHRARVTYRVDSGPRASIRDIVFTGELGPLTPSELQRPLRLAAGDGYRASSVREAPERLQRFLAGRGYRLATIEAPVEHLSDDGLSVDLEIALALGPKLELEVLGAERKQLERRDLLPFLGPYGYDEALLLQSINLIRRDFQERGHYRVVVDRHEERGDGVVRLRLAIVPGPVMELADVSFVGNQTIASEELARRMTTGPRRPLRPRSGRLVDEVLAEDLTNLRSTYALAGHAQAKVGPVRIEERPGNQLALTIPIHEGPRRTVETLALAGVENLDAATLSAGLPLSVGGPYHRILLDQCLEQLRSRYESEGFARALVSADVTWDASGERARVAIGVIEGTRTKIDRVILRGNRRTRTAVLQRLIDLPPGTPASPARLLAVERDLYRLGIFSSVGVNLAPGPEGSESRGVVVEVEEGKTRRVSAGAGYDSDGGARGLLTLGESNLFGRAGNLQLDLLASQRDERYRLVYGEQRLFGWPLSGTATTYWERQERTSYDLERWGTQVGLTRDVRAWRLRLIYDYHIAELPRVDDALAVPVGSRSARVSSVTPVVALEKRDDPIDPRRGWNALGQLQYAFPLFSADARFLKGFIQGSYNLDLGSLGTLAGSARIGAIEPLGPLGSASTPSPDDVPIDERFFAGGRSSHRAFAQDELGIPGETLVAGDPVGGNGLLVLNLDWRFPIAGDFGGTLFLDGGNVWLSRQEIDPEGLRWGAGFGVRYRSPVGPLRLEIGWKLDRKPDEPAYVWFFSLGNPF